jgi:hypothetical protein
LQLYNFQPQKAESLSRQAHLILHHESFVCEVMMNRKSVFYTVPFVLLALAAVGCTSAQSPPASQPTAQTISLPDTTGNAMRSYLQSVDYQENWHLWPGKGEKYTGVEPHGMLLTTYLNQTALDALNGKQGAMPNEAIIVKENYMPDGVLDAITVMYKVDGYNDEHNDWFWTKILADGTIDAEGQVEGCQSCHRAKRDNDYVYTGELQ